VPQVYLLVGLTGSGKASYSARALEPAGVIRLSVDELIYDKHGRYGVDYPAESYSALYAATLAEIRSLVALEVSAGHDVALDLGIFSRADRDEWKRWITELGATWRLLYFPVSRAEVLHRLTERNRLGGASGVPVRESDLDAFYARFEEPLDEGEEVIQPGSY
jgi:predicted kinase